MNGAVVQTGFNGEIQLIADAGGNVSLRTIRLVSGWWSGNLSLDTATPQTRIIATTTDGNHVQGQSNPFQVQGAASAMSVTVKTVQNQDAPLSGVTVTLGNGETSTQATSDANGLAVFPVAGAYLFEITARKTGYVTEYTAVNASGMSVFKTVELQLARPPVILVPGIMGSCSGVKWLFYPMLPKGYRTSQSLLQLFPPTGYGIPYVTDVGWSDLKASLRAAGFAVYEAPWDWRMPAVRPDYNNHVAWKDYLKPIIDRAKSETGAQKVDIVAHSMGGLMTRAYIQDLDYAGDIGRFAMVGTPNEGSAKAYYLWFGGDTGVDAVYEDTISLNYEAWTGGKWENLKPLASNRSQGGPYLSRRIVFRD
jgi:pimeloyl-ACP methyl ester carboxylesterase